LNYRVRVSDFATADMVRLAAFLKSKSSPAASDAIDRILEAVDSLRVMPLRGKLNAGELRELPVRFGSFGYVIQYGVEREDVTVLRIFHALEDR
jgi:toxin ParE1/3/4